MLQPRMIAKFALAAQLLLGVSNAFALQPVPVPGQQPASVDLGLEAGCFDCDLAVPTQRVPQAVQALAEVSESEEFKNQTIFYKDDLVAKSHAKGSEWAPVGVLYDPVSKNRLTATLVDECHVFTARHIVGATSEIEDRSKADGKKFVFNVGAPTAKKPFETQVNATPVAWGDYESSFHETHKDWMLLKLDDCVGSADRYGHIKMEPVSIYDLGADAPLVKAGYPRNRDLKSIWVDETCAAKSGNTRGYLYTDCAVLAGDSGASLFVRKADGSLRLIANQSWGIDSEDVRPEYIHRDANIGFSVKPIRSELGQHVPYLNETQFAELNRGPRR